MSSSSAEEEEEEEEDGEEDGEEEEERWFPSRSWNVHERRIRNKTVAFLRKALSSAGAKSSISGNKVGSADQHHLLRPRITKVVNGPL